MTLQIKENKKTYTVFLHILVWMLYITLPYLMTNEPFNDRNIFLKVPRTLVFIGYFYLNYLIYIPKLFQKKKYFSFIAINLICLILIIIINTKFLSPNTDLIPETVRKIAGRRNSLFNFRFVSLFFVFFLTSFSLRLFENWKKREKQLKESEREQLKSELLYLKVQINPHFLFNTLNSIYSLSIRKSEKTPNIVLKLADLMRYMIYTSSQKRVDLEAEIEYIKSYIDLQKLRLFDTVKILFEIKNNEVAYKIEPMLLIPFVENTFKYGISYTENCEINISIQIENNKLSLITENTVFNKKAEIENESGIGLTNVKRRLHLLYPNKHILIVSEKENKYKVNLLINLSKK